MPAVTMTQGKARGNPRRQGPHRGCLAVILAAGEGKRIRSARPKVLHEVAGRSMIAHVVEAVRQAGADRIAVVVGPDREDVAAEVKMAFENVVVFVQAQRRGTAHAVLAARDALRSGDNDVLVVFGDTPLIRAETLARMRAVLDEGAPCVVLGFEARDPTGYGRLLLRDDQLLAIREEKDASAEERKIKLCNAGLMGFSGKAALPILEAITDQNMQREFYLTDAVEVARSRKLDPLVLIAGQDEVMGVNDRVQLAEAEAVMQRRLRTTAMLGGATLTAPDTVFFSYDTALARDVVVESHVVFGPGVTVEESAVIRAFSHIEGARVRSGAIVGPFARLRPGADIGEGAHIGNFVEVKKARIGPRAKANHLAYLGDATVGEGANIGAGTITCNYDGFDKHRTEIGAGAFIGSNSALVAPISIGEGAYVASGSVITEDVAADALAVGRGRQVTKSGWAETFRQGKRNRKLPPAR